MRKILCLVLALALTIGLCACGAKDDIKLTKKTDETITDAEKPTNEDETTEGGETPEVEDEPESSKNDITKIGDVLYEDDNVKVEFAGLDFQEVDALEQNLFIELAVENKSDMKMNVYFSDGTVNSIMTFASNVDAKLAAGEKTDDNLLLMFSTGWHSDGVGLTSLDDIKEVQLKMNYTDGEGFDVDVDVEKLITIYPNKDRDYDLIGYEPTGDDKVLIDNEEFQLIYKGHWVEDDFESMHVDYYILGKDDKEHSMWIDFKIGDVEQSQSALAPMMLNSFPGKEYHDEMMIWHRDARLMDESETFAIRFRILGDSYKEIGVTDWFEFELDKPEVD